MVRGVFYFFAFLVVVFFLFLFFDDSLSFAPPQPENFACGQTKTENLVMKAGLTSSEEGYGESAVGAPQAENEARLHCMKILANDAYDKFKGLKPNQLYDLFSCEEAKQACIDGGGEEKDCSQFNEDNVVLSQSKIDFVCKTQAENTDPKSWVSYCTCTVKRDISYDYTYGCTTCSKDGGTQVDAQSIS